MLMNALTLGCLLAHRQERRITTTENEHEHKKRHEEQLSAHAGKVGTQRATDSERLHHT